MLLSQALSTQADDVLQTRAEAVAQTVTVAADGSVSVLEARDDQALDVGTWIFDGSGTVVERPPGSPSAVDTAAAEMATAGAGTRDLDVGEPVRLLALPLQENGSTVAAVVTSTYLSPYQQVERLALLGSIEVAVLPVGIVHLILRANVGRALRPVQQMSAQASRWSADDVDQRFGTEPRPAELAELAGTPDQLLDARAAVLRHEQRFSEELSHELRSPLARAQAEVDLLSTQPRSAAELQDAHSAIDRSITSMRSILDTMMSAARSSTSMAPGRVRLTEALARVADPEARDSPVPVIVDCPPDLVVGVDADVVVRVLSPVIDDALLFARTVVTVRATRQDGRVQVTVVDDGPGMSATEAQRASEPGFRGDSDDGHPGAGLGLALVRRLVLAAGGSVHAHATDSGGCVKVVLPPA